MSSNKASSSLSIGSTTASGVALTSAGRRHASSGDWPEPVRGGWLHQLDTKVIGLGLGPPPRRRVPDATQQPAAPAGRPTHHCHRDGRPRCHRSRSARAAARRCGRTIRPVAESDRPRLQSPAPSRTGVDRRRTRWLPPLLAKAALPSPARRVALVPDRCGWARLVISLRLVAPA